MLRDMSIIAFYGAENRDLFAIERAAMDRPGNVIRYLDEVLPDGDVLDIGAGDGYTADALATSERSLFGVEPAQGMISRERTLTYVRASAEALPFADKSFSGAYATWAYFFPDHLDISAGLAEVERVVRRGGPIVIVDNYGGDEFSSLLGHRNLIDTRFWEARGFIVTEIDTVFEFASQDDADQLLSLYAGQAVRGVPLVIGYRVAVMTRTN